MSGKKRYCRVAKSAPRNDGIRNWRDYNKALVKRGSLTFESLIALLDLPIEAADYSTVCRRQKKLDIKLQKGNRNESLHGVFDSTGLKVFGEGEWKVRQHGYGKRRTWRKLHLGVDEASGEIIASVLTTNDFGDGEILPETTMFRFKKVFGGNLRAITFENQATEAFIKCNILNRMTSLGMPASYSIS